MGNITALQVQKSDRTRVNVFIDGEFALGLAMGLAANLKLGQEVSAADLETMQHQDEFERAKGRVYRLLARRPYSTVEVSRYLRRKNIEDETSDAVIAYMTEHNYLDDKAFADYWIEQRESFRPRSRYALQQELFTKGIDRAIVDIALENFDDYDAARRLADKHSRRLHLLGEDEFLAKLGGYLQRRGFSYGVVQDVTGETWQAICEASTETE